MNYEIEIQRHAKVSDFIGHNDLRERTTEEKESALSLYKTQKWEKEQNGIKAVYVAAFDLDNNYIGGICWVNDDKVYGYSHTEEQHQQFINQF